MTVLELPEQRRGLGIRHRLRNFGNRSAGAESCARKLVVSCHIKGELVWAIRTQNLTPAIPSLYVVFSYWNWKSPNLTLSSCSGVISLDYHCMFCYVVTIIGSSLYCNHLQSHSISEFEEEGQEGLDQEQAGRRQGEAQPKVNELTEWPRKLFEIGWLKNIKVLLDIFVLMSFVCDTHVFTHRSFNSRAFEKWLIWRRKKFSNV